MNGKHYFAMWCITSYLAFIICLVVEITPLLAILFILTGLLDAIVQGFDRLGSLKLEVVEKKK